MKINIEFTLTEADIEKLGMREMGVDERNTFLKEKFYREPLLNFAHQIRFNQPNLTITELYNETKQLDSISFLEY